MRRLTCEVLQAADGPEAVAIAQSHPSRIHLLVAALGYARQMQDMDELPPALPPAEPV